MHRILFLSITSTVYITNVIWTDKPPYILRNIFAQTCRQMYRQFQLHLAARRMRITYFNLILRVTAWQTAQVYTGLKSFSQVTLSEFFLNFDKFS